jgi:hypothetical protein
MECNELCTAHGTGIGEMICCNDLGELWEARGEFDTARSFFDRALQVRQELGAVHMGSVHGSMASSLLAVATVAEKQGDTATASQLLHDAIPFAEASREADVARQIDDLLRRLSQAEATNRATLRPEGGTWHIQYNGTDVHIPDLKGLSHLRALLGRPPPTRDRALAHWSIERRAARHRRHRAGARSGGAPEVSATPRRAG